MFTAIVMGVLSLLTTGDRPNVLLITADDLGLQLSCYGDDTIDTPNIDRLAARGVLFRTAYVSQASCSPSRSTMFTGLYPHANGHYGLANAKVGFRLHESIQPNTLPNRLVHAGYRTGIIGKLHVNPYDSFQFQFNEKAGFGSRDVRQQVEFAERFWREAGDAPWFLMFNMFDPHVQFQDQVKGIPENPVKAQDVKAWPWQQISAPEQLERIAGYYNCVQRIDHAIGLLMDSLAASGHDEDTAIIFLGDHGPPFARAKTSCYESGLRVPFLVYWPGVSEPHVSERLVSTADIFPTILDAAGIDLPDAVHGRSLRPVVAPEAAAQDVPWREYLAAEFHYHGARPFFPRRAITDGRFKLIHNLHASKADASPTVDGDRAPLFAQQLPADHVVRAAFERLHHPPEWEFYDLEQDPVEFHNLVEEPDYRDSLSRLQEALRRWREETNDPFREAEFRQEIEERFSAAAEQLQREPKR